jgi:hypothetical protein
MIAQTGTQQPSVEADVMTRIVTRVCTAVALFAVLAAVPPAAPAAYVPNPIFGLLPMLQQLGYPYQVLNGHAVLVQVPLVDGGVYPVMLVAQEDGLGNCYYSAVAYVAQYPGTVPPLIQAKVTGLNYQLTVGQLVAVWNNGWSTIVLVARLPAGGQLYLAQFLQAVAMTSRACQVALQYGY